MGGSQKSCDSFFSNLAITRESMSHVNPCRIKDLERSGSSLQQLLRGPLSTISTTYTLLGLTLNQQMHATKTERR